MFATKLTLIMTGALLYLAGSGCWFFWITPRLQANSEKANILYAFAGTCGWMLITFSLIVHITKTAPPKAGGGR